MKTVDNRPGASTRRDTSADVMRGIAIILVVLGHALRGAFALQNEPSVALGFLDWLIYSFHMPAFFYLAGYFTAVSLKSKAVPQFLRGRFSAVIWPYLLWSVIFYAAGQAMSRLTAINEPVSLTQLLHIGWAPIHVLWFLYALLIMQLIAGAAVRAPILALLVSLAFDATVSFFGSELAILGRTAVHAPFFFLGLLLSVRNAPPLPVNQSASKAAGACVLFGAAAFGVYSLGIAPPVGFMTLPLSLAGVAALTLVSSHVARSKHGLAALLASLGRASLAIYLLHILVLAVVPRLLRYAGWDSVEARLIVGTLVGTLGSYALFLALRKVKLTKPLGLR